MLFDVCYAMAAVLVVEAARAVEKWLISTL